MYMAGVPAHVIQRGNNRCACFFHEDDYIFYRACLADACARYQVDLHAYVLMGNHVHLLMTPGSPDGIPRVMQSLGRRYVQYVNKTYQRTGTLWESRHRASVVDAVSYLLACHRYIEMNPVRAGIAKHPGEYPWSSYRANAYGEPEGMLTAHAVVEALGAALASRCRGYRELFRTELDPEIVHDIRQAADFAAPLGGERFKRQVERALGRPVGRTAYGRPRRAESSV
ncbi:MAG TPA: transposase [Gammaproteobacteria bacterium]|nr:transposase [Gammaproteobacteria bacterium]